MSEISCFRACASTGVCPPSTQDATFRLCHPRGGRAARLLPTILRHSATHARMTACTKTCRATDVDLSSSIAARPGHYWPQRRSPGPPVRFGSTGRLTAAVQGFDNGTPDDCQRNYSAASANVFAAGRKGQLSSFSAMSKTNSILARPPR